LGGEWINANSNFDHMGHAMATVLHMGTGEGWLDVLIDVVNSAGVDKQPRRNIREEYSFLILVFVWIASSFLVNLMIGVLTDQYQVTKDGVYGTELQSLAERRWLGVQRRLFGNPDLLKPLWKVGGPFVNSRMVLVKFVDTKTFDAFIFACICGNTVVMSMEGPTVTGTTEEILEAVGICFLSIFNIEIFLKLFCYLNVFFQEPWNVFDCIIVWGSNASFLAQRLSSTESPMVAVLDAFRILRVMRLVRVCTFLRNYCKTMLQLIPALMNVSLLLLLLLFIYACLGIGLFGTISPGELIDDDINFNNFGNALLLVLRVSTGEDWQKLMYDTVKDRGNCTTAVQTAKELERDGPRGCGSILGYPYFITFTSFVSIVLMNIIIAVILEGFQAMEQIESYEIYLTEIKIAAKEWLKVDTKGSGYLTLDRVAGVLVAVPQPVGFAGRPQKKVAHQLRYLPVYDGKVHFRDVVVLSAKRVYAWMNHLQEQEANDVKIDPTYFGRWCSFFPEVPRPDRSIESFLVGHVLVKKYLDELIIRRKRKRRVELAQAYINEQIQDAQPLRKGTAAKLMNQKPAESAPAAEGRNASGLLNTKGKAVPVAAQVGGPLQDTLPASSPSMRPEEVEFQPPQDPSAPSPFPWPPAGSSVGPGQKADQSAAAKQEVHTTLPVGSGYDLLYPKKASDPAPW